MLTDQIIQGHMVGPETAVEHRGPSKDKISCFFCGEEMTLNKMRNHVGSHILHALHNTEDPKVCHLGSIGENPCGFCGQDGCFTQLKLKKHGGFSIAHFTILGCSTKKQQSSPRFYHAQMYQFIAVPSFRPPFVV